MTRLIFGAIALLALAGCGADGMPMANSAPETGVTISGDARMGVVGTL